MEAAGAEGAAGTTDAAGAAGEDRRDGGEDGKPTRITEGEGERGPSRTDGATTPDIATSPSWRVMGEVKNSPEEPWLMGEEEVEGLAMVVVAATSATGGKAASMIFRVNARETIAAE